MDTNLQAMKINNKIKWIQMNNFNNEIHIKYILESRYLQNLCNWKSWYQKYIIKIIVKKEFMNKYKM